MDWAFVWERERGKDLSRRSHFFNFDGRLSRAPARLSSWDLPLYHPREIPSHQWDFPFSGESSSSVTSFLGIGVWEVSFWDVAYIHRRIRVESGVLGWKGNHFTSVFRRPCSIDFWSPGLHFKRCLSFWFLFLSRDLISSLEKPSEFSPRTLCFKF